MTEFNTPLAPRSAEADALREERHAVLRDLLGAYADRELPPETLSQLDAHLVGCADCRADLALQERMRDRLAAEPSIPPTPALRLRLSTALDAVPLAAASDDDTPAARTRSRATLVAIAVMGWMVASLAIVGVIQGRRDGREFPLASERARPVTLAVHEVPLLDGVLENYGRLVVSDMPGRARDLSAVRAAVGFPVEPLHGTDVRLLGAWTTEIRGEPAAVLAYRLDDRLIVQYVVAEDVFFRHPAMRSAVATRHLLTATDGERALVAWPGATAGSVLVGSVPATELMRVWMAEGAR